MVIIYSSSKRQSSYLFFSWLATPQVGPRPLCLPKFGLIAARAYHCAPRLVGTHNSLPKTCPFCVIALRTKSTPRILFHELKITREPFSMSGWALGCHHLRDSFKYLIALIFNIVLDHRAPSCQLLCQLAFRLSRSLLSSLLRDLCAFMCFMDLNLSLICCCTLISVDCMCLIALIMQLQMLYGFL